MAADLRLTPGDVYRKDLDKIRTLIRSRRPTTLTNRLLPIRVWDPPVGRVARGANFVTVYLNMAINIGAAGKEIGPEGGAGRYSPSASVYMVGWKTNANPAVVRRFALEFTAPPGAGAAPTLDAIPVEQVNTVAQAPDLNPFAAPPAANAPKAVRDAFKAETLMSGNAQDGFVPCDGRYASLGFVALPVIDRAMLAGAVTGAASYVHGPTTAEIRRHVGVLSIAVAEALRFAKVEAGIQEALAGRTYNSEDDHKSCIDKWNQRSLGS